MISRRATLALAPAFALLASGAVRAQEMPKIVVAGPPIDDFKTVYYGIRSGLFKKYGVEVEALQTNSGAAALAGVIGGSVQVAFTSVPAVLQGYARGAILTARPLPCSRSRTSTGRYDAIAKRFQASVFVSTADYVAANTDAMGRFVRAMHDSIVYTNTHLPETVPLVASYTGVEPATVAKSVRAIDPEYIDPKDLQPVIDVAFRYKLIDRSFTADELISSVALRRPR